MDGPPCGQVVVEQLPAEALVATGAVGSNLICQAILNSGIGLETETTTTTAATTTATAAVVEEVEVEEEVEEEEHEQSPETIIKGGFWLPPIRSRSMLLRSVWRWRWRKRK